MGFKHFLLEVSEVGKFSQVWHLIAIGFYAFEQNIPNGLIYMRHEVPTVNFINMWMNKFYLLPSEEGRKNTFDGGKA